MRPIDSENVIAWLNVQIEKVQLGWLHDYGFPTNVIAELTEVKRFVKNLPTIEPEVRHGRWKDNGEDKFICSACKGYVYRWFGKSDFCPRCGARMDGGADNGN
jgi:hypothetical protein